MAFALESAFPDPDKADPQDVKKFFISYGRVWCGVMRPAARKMYLKTNPHALPKARINQQVMHRDLFHKAFQCKKGDKMYLDPADRVQIW